LTPCNIVILGLTITSSWGNGHATTYRGMMRELVRSGYNVLFLERDMPWYAKNRDFEKSEFGQIELYTSIDELKNKFKKNIVSAELVIVGSYIPEGIYICDWVTDIARGITAFYDIDTPVTVAKLAQKKCEYLIPQLIPRFDLYLSFAGGPILDLLTNVYGALLTKPLFCSVDPDCYYPGTCKVKYDLGYMGTFSDDRQESLERLMFEPARKMENGHFIVAGPLYPDKQLWPSNVSHLDHIAPSDHRDFYCSQRFTLNLTRADMIQSGFAPSVRLFEAAACGIPVISDYWDGLDSLFTFNEEILLSANSEQTLDYLKNITDHQRIVIGNKARTKVLAYHTAATRVKELESYWEEAIELKFKRAKGAYQKKKHRKNIQVKNHG
jgi:spore maturation protein CgeB